MRHHNVRCVPIAHRAAKPSAVFNCLLAATRRGHSPRHVTRLVRRPVDADINPATLRGHERGPCFRDLERNHIQSPVTPSEQQKPEHERHAARNRTRPPPPSHLHAKILPRKLRIEVPKPAAQARAMWRALSLHRKPTQKKYLE